MGTLAFRLVGKGPLGAVCLSMVLVASLLAATPASALIVDGGFESGVLGGPDLPPMALSIGLWTRRDTNSRLTMAPEPVHSGSRSAVVDTLNSSIGSFIIQDFPSGNASYRFTFWVYPVQGINGISVFYNWDRGVAGFREPGTAVTLTPTGLVFGGWNAPPGSFPPLAPNSWHEVHVVANRCTLVQSLFVDGGLLGSFQASGTAPSGNATVAFGDGSFVANHGLFYYDDFAFDPFDCACDDDEDDDGDDSHEGSDDDGGDDARDGEDDGDDEHDDGDDDAGSGSVELAVGTEQGLRLMGDHDQNDDGDDGARDDGDDDDDDQQGDEDNDCPDEEDHDSNAGSGQDGGSEGGDVEVEEGNAGDETPRTIDDGARGGHGTLKTEDLGAPGTPLSSLAPWVLAGIAGVMAATRIARRYRGHS